MRVAKKSLQKLVFFSLSLEVCEAAKDSKRHLFRTADREEEAQDNNRKLCIDAGSFERPEHKKSNTKQRSKQEDIKTGFSS